MLIPEEQKFQPLPFIKDEVPGMEIKESQFSSRAEKKSISKKNKCLENFFKN